MERGVFEKRDGFHLRLEFHLSLALLAESQPDIMLRILFEIRSGQPWCIDEVI